jgi:two-component system response regulator RegX3
MSAVNTEHASDGLSALREVQQRRYDLVVADDRLPDVDMESFLPHLALHRCGVLVVSSDDSQHTVLLLEDGADDVVARPYSEAELRARIRAILRRRAPQPRQLAAELVVGALRLHVASSLVTVRGQRLHLPRLEFAVLLALQSRDGAPVPRGVLLEECWSPTTARRPEHVDAIIRRLRVRLELQPSHPRHLITIRSKGYALRA